MAKRVVQKFQQIFQKKKKFRLFLLSFIIFGSFSFPVKADDVNVSATIKDTVPPSTPILISPTDDSLITDATPEFSWYESTDDWTMSHYVLYIDGSDVFGEIPLSSYENDDYTLTYDSTNKIYSLVPKDSLSDGNHTWKVRAYDFGDNTSVSDTWSFELDTQAPNFTVTQIGDRTMSISAGSTPPEDAIVIFANDATANEPIITATGEAYSEVQLTVTIPGDPTQSFTEDIESNGSWELQLGILPRDTVIELDFVITDRAGHVSVLEDLLIMISLVYYPGTPTPTSPTGTITGTTTPSPSIEPSYTISPPVSPSITVSPTLSVTAEPTPGEGVDDPGIQIPIIPPREIIHEAAQEISERLPDKIANFFRYLFSSEFWKKIAIYFALIILLLHLLFSYLIILTKFIHDLSLQLLKKLLILILPFRVSKKNLVFNYRQTTVVPLVKVNLLDAQTGEIIDFQITNHLGNFSDFNWPNRNFKLAIKDKNFYYPIGDQKPAQLSKKEFYQDEIFEFREMDQKPIMIPTIMAQGQESLPFFEQIRVFCLYLLSYPWWFFMMIFLPVLIITLRYPSAINHIALAYYLYILLRKLTKGVNRSSLRLNVLADSGQKFSSNLVLSLTAKESKDSQALITKATFAEVDPLKLKRSNYLLTIFTFNYSQWDYRNAIYSQRIHLKEKENKLDLRVKYIRYVDNNVENLKPASKL